MCPVERCRQLIADVTGALVSDGFVHSCLAKAASLAADVVRLIRALITAAAVAGFNEDGRLRVPGGPGTGKKYVHGAFTERYSAFWLGTRGAGLDGGCRDPAGLRRDRGLRPVPELLPPRVGARRGKPGGLAHILRDYQDCAENYPGAIWPVQAQRALRGLIRAWHAACDQGLPAIPAAP